MFGRATIRLGIGPHSSVNLESRSERRCTRLAANAERKKVAKNRHLGTTPQLCRAISSQLRHVSTIGKNLLSSNISSICPHNMVNFGPLAAEIVSLVVAVSQTAAFNRGRHLYSAGRPARWALAHILVITLFGSHPQFCYCEPLEICGNCTH